MVLGVGSPFHKPFQCQQTTGLSCFLLAIYLLEAQDIGIEPDELRPHHSNALLRVGVCLGLLSRFSRLNVAMRMFVGIFSSLNPSPTTGRP